MDCRASSLLAGLFIIISLAEIRANVEYSPPLCSNLLRQSTKIAFGSAGASTRSLGRFRSFAGALSLQGNVLSTWKPEIEFGPSPVLWNQSLWYKLATERSIFVDSYGNLDEVNALKFFNPSVCSDLFVRSLQHTTEPAEYLLFGISTISICDLSQTQNTSE